MASTPSGRGYWLVASDGGIFSFGDASFHGSTGAVRLNRPIVGMAPTPSGRGYWLVASDGGIFTFGDAVFHGSSGGTRLNGLIVGIAPTPSGGGYWLGVSDGTVFGFGDAASYGSLAAFSSQPVVGITASPDGRGYWLTTSSGDVFSFGDAVVYGSATPYGPSSPVIDIVASRSGVGYWLVTRNGSVFSFPTQVPTSSASTYNYLVTNADRSPVRYNPCQVLHYVVNLSQAPARALTDVEATVGRLATLTGIPFAYDGTTTEFPSTARSVYQPQTYGNRWVPLLMAWEQPGQTDFLTSGAVGDGGSTYLASTSGEEAYVTGQAAFDATRALPDGFGDPVGWGAVVLHEFGHVMGLAHVSDPSQVMFPYIHPNGPIDYGSGDRSGLAHLGLPAGCISVPQASSSASLARVGSPMP